MAKKVHLRDFLTPITFGQGERVAVTVDPATRFGFVAEQDPSNPSKLVPVRIDSNFSKAIVPVFDLAALKIDEDEAILRVLFEAGAASPLTMPSPKAMDQAFWVKNRTHREGILLNPKSKVFLPVGIRAYRSELVDPMRVLLLGRAQHVGYYVQQGHRRGVLAHDKKGLLLVTFNHI